MDEKLKINVESYGGEPRTAGYVSVHFWSKEERLQRALKFGGITCGLAFASIFIPGLHFVLVPGFLFASPIVFVVFLRKEKALDGGRAECPICKKEFDITKGNLPLKQFCTACGAGVKIFEAT